MKIKDITALEILDSRANPTVSVKVILENGVIASAAVPSGASTGKYEACELRDGDGNRFGGQGVLKAIDNIEKIIKPALLGISCDEQEKIDRIMIDLDNTENKSNLGANAILGVSLAVSRAAATSLNLPLYSYLSKFNPDFNGKFIMPMPMFNLLNGGKHADWAADIQEYMVIAKSAKSLAQAVRMGAEVYRVLKKVLKVKSYAISVGDEGGFAPDVDSNSEPFDLLKEAIEKAGYELGKDFVFAVDVAASEFFKDNAYHLKKEDVVLSGEELLDYYFSLMEKYEIVSIEDGFDEDDWQNFKAFNVRSKGKVQNVGDDLFVTNTSRLKKGIEEQSANSILIKLNQIGTITETVEAILLARKNNLTSIISHRSGETEDSYIADFAVAMGTGQIKTGAPARSERAAKYNRLMEIEAELGKKAVLAEFPFSS